MALPSPPTITDAELSAFVDGEAAPERRALIEAWLARNPAQAARVKAWRRQNQALRMAMGRLLCEEPPERPQERRAEAESKLTPLFPDAPAPSRRAWDRRDILALVCAASFLAGAGVACLAGYFMG